MFSLTVEFMHERAWQLFHCARATIITRLHALLEVLEYNILRSATVKHKQGRMYINSKIIYISYPAYITGFLYQVDHVGHFRETGSSDRMNSLGRVSRSSQGFTNWLFGRPASRSPSLQLVKLNAGCVQFFLFFNSAFVFSIQMLMVWKST